MKKIDLIRNFWLRSPNAMTGMFWIEYKKPDNQHCRHPVFISIRDLYRLFKTEGVDPLVVEEDESNGYYFSKAVLRNDGSFIVELESNEQIEVVCIEVLGVTPVEGK